MISVPSDLTVHALLRAYRAGYFPMPVRRRIAWFSPNPRGIFLPGHMRVTRSMRQAAKRYEIRLNTSFDEVISACGDPGRAMGWINRPILDAFTDLHHQGYAQSIETWDEHGLAGGLYGVSLGGLFAGESMFHRRRDASKVALMALGEIMETIPGSIIDTQWTTEHLVSLGAFDVARTDYATLLEGALTLPSPPAFARDDAPVPLPTPESTLL